MSNNEQSENESTWSTTRRNILAEQREIGSNKVMQVDIATNTSHQKITDVPVYSDAAKTPLPEYLIDINQVSYNFDNVRLWKYKKKKCRELGIDLDEGLDEENPDHQKIIHDMLLNTKSYSTKSTASLRKDLLIKGQEDAALITEDGVLWNGNRRCAVMRDIYANPPAGESPDSKWQRIKVCFLPNDLDKKQLRDLEKRLQQQADTKEEYGRVNEMGDIHDYLENYEFTNPEGYEKPTPEEKVEIEREFEDTDEWKSWKKIIHAKKIIDLMDDYLNSRDTDANPLIGNYDFIESNESGVTWFEDLVSLLNVVSEYYENHSDLGDPDEKVEAYKNMAFASYDAGKPDFDVIRKFRNTFEKADGSGKPGDSTNLLLAAEANSPIISNWEQISQEPESLVRNDELAKQEKENLETNLRSFKQLGNDPKVILKGVSNDILNINQNLILSNDQELIALIQKCRDALQEIQNKTEESSA